MCLIYFILLGVLTLKVKGYNPNRPVKINVAESVHLDNFPEVEYPTSILDSKPFYFSSSPFSNDVQSSFKSLSSGGTTKPVPAIILNIKSGDNQKEKNNKDESVTPEKGGENITIISTVKDMDSNVKQTKGTMPKYPFYEDLEDDIVSQEKKKENTSDQEDIDDFIELSDGLDVFGAILTDDETEYIDMTNSTMQIFDSEYSKEITTITSDVTSVNSDSVVKLNDTTSLTEMNLFDDSTNTSSVAYLLINEGINDTTFSNDTQGDFIIEIIETPRT